MARRRSEAEPGVNSGLGGIATALLASLHSSPPLTSEQVFLIKSSWEPAQTQRLETQSSASPCSLNPAVPQFPRWHGGQ